MADPMRLLATVADLDNDVRSKVRYVVKHNQLYAMTVEQYTDMLAAQTAPGELMPQEHGAVHIGWVELNAPTGALMADEANERLGKLYRQKRADERWAAREAASRAEGKGESDG